jgi:hypothetical protein
MFTIITILKTIIVSNNNSSLKPISHYLIPDKWSTYKNSLDKNFNKQNKNNNRQEITEESEYQQYEDKRNFKDIGSIVISNRHNKNNSNIPDNQDKIDDYKIKEDDNEDSFDKKLEKQMKEQSNNSNISSIQNNLLSHNHNNTNSLTPTQVSNNLAQKEFSRDNMVRLDTKSSFREKAANKQVNSIVNKNINNNEKRSKSLNKFNNTASKEVSNKNNLNYSNNNNNKSINKPRNIQSIHIENKDIYTENENETNKDMLINCTNCHIINEERNKLQLEVTRLSQYNEELENLLNLEREKNNKFKLLAEEIFSYYEKENSVKETDNESKHSKSSVLNQGNYQKSKISALNYSNTNTNCNNNSNNNNLNKKDFSNKNNKTVNNSKGLIIKQIKKPQTTTNNAKNIRYSN